MQYCINFDKDNRYLEQADEVIIEYHQGKTELRLKPFLDAHPNQKIILNINIDDFSQRFLETLQYLVEYSNFRLKIHTTGFIAHLKSQIPVPFFFTTPAKTYEDLYKAAQCGACEVYIDSALGFALRDCRTIADKLNIKLRSLPFLPLEYTGEHHKSYWQYFIRPEDVDLYGHFIDTIELYGPVSYVNVLYQAYQEKKWNGRLNEIFPYLTDNYDNRYIIGDWSIKRVNCHRRCMVIPRCTICKDVYDLAISLEQLGVIIPAEIRRKEITPDIEKIEEKTEQIKPNF